MKFLVEEGFGTIRHLDPEIFAIVDCIQSYLKSE